MGKIKYSEIHNNPPTEYVIYETSEPRRYRGFKKYYVVVEYEDDRKSGIVLDERSVNTIRDGKKLIDKWWTHMTMWNNS